MSHFSERTANTICSHVRWIKSKGKRLISQLWISCIRNCNCWRWWNLIDCCLSCIRTCGSTRIRFQVFFEGEPDGRKDEEKPKQIDIEIGYGLQIHVIFHEPYFDVRMRIYVHKYYSLNVRILRAHFGVIGFRFFSGKIKISSRRTWNGTPTDITRHCVVSFNYFYDIFVVYQTGLQQDEAASIVKTFYR